MANSSENYMQFYHVPQQSRREKLRYSHEEEVLLLSNPNNLLFCTTNPTSQQQQQHNQQQQIYLSLSSSTASAATSSICQQGVPRQQLGPFTGYAEILSRSKFLEPARLLLEDICNVGGVVNTENGEGMDAFLMEVDREILTGGRMDGRMNSSAVVDQQDQAQQEWKETKLVSMLDEVYRRYKLYYQQVQSVIASFESVPGLGSAAPYAAMSFKAMSKHFKCLKNAMTEQLVHINKGGTAIKESFFQEESNSGFGQINRFGNNNYSTLRQPHIWRPQRGLPEKAVAVLRSWLFDHFLHPYPSDTDKQMLAKQTGLTRNQVSNWFINARVRLWKPMVEEIHSLEVRQQARTDTMDKQSQLPSSSTAASLNGGPPPIHNPSSKRPHDHMSRANIPNQIMDQEPNYDNLVGYNSHGFDVGGNRGSVSLTLGLHQNDGAICMNHAHHFGLGLEECHDPYALGPYGGQDRHLLHDFVGEALL